MGGTALKHLGFEGRRICREEYFEIVLELKELAKGKIDNFKDILHYKNKLDHGDIDFVGYAENFDEKKLKEIFPCKYVSKNSCVYSFDYKNVQIDLAFLDDVEKLNYYYLFSCFSPLGNVLGRIIKQKGLKWGIDGLSYPIKLSDVEQLGEVSITYGTPFCTFEKMLDFLSLKHNFGNCFQNFKDYFENQQDIFEWVCSSKMFNKDIFAFENLNHVNRKRDRLRKDYHQWMEFIKDKQNNFVRDEDKTVYIEEIYKHFGTNVHKEAEQMISKHVYKKFLKGKFNGKMVRDWTGLEGEALGKVIKAYKESIENFDNFVQLKTVENIEKHFKMFYKNYESF